LHAVRVARLLFAFLFLGFSHSGGSGMRWVHTEKSGFRTDRTLLST
jgi:hypothetical protein